MGGTAHYYSGTDRSIGQGTWTFLFNPSGDVAGATADEARIRLFLDYNNGASVDLGKVKIYIEAPDGTRDTLYNNANLNWWNDDDDGNDSDPASDFDISFWGTDPKSKIDYVFHNPSVNGNWKLIVQNDTGKTLTLDYFEAWVDYDSPADLKIKDIQISGTQDVGQPVLIEAWIENTGDKWYSSSITLEYLVEGKVIGTSTLPGGLLPGVTNYETELHTFTKVGSNSVEVRIAGGTDVNKSNNTRTEYFNFDHNQPDLTVADIKVTGDGNGGSGHFITATVENIGNATYWSDIKLEYLVEDKVIGTQTIGLGPISGIPAGWSNDETEFHVFNYTGAVDVEVRIVGSSDYDTSNDSRTETYYFGTPSSLADLVVSDVRVAGGWSKGDVVDFDVFIENVGTGGWNLLAGSPQVEYSVLYEGDTSWTSVGTDTITLGLWAGGGGWQFNSFTLAEDGPFRVKAEVSGNDLEASSTNNSWTEEFGHSRHDLPQKTVANSADDIKLGMWLARTIYGDVDIPSDYRDAHENGLKDRYDTYLKTQGFKVLTDTDFGDLYRPVDGLSQFYKGGLFAGDVSGSIVNPLNPDSWQAQGLVAVGDDGQGNKTLTLTFRGTDPKDLVEATTGQSWLASGQYDYYESMRPLIDAALAYANDSTNGIKKMVVSGHSLGGATADIFSMMDAHRLKAAVDLTVVSFASAGIRPELLIQSPLLKGMNGQYDPANLSSNSLALNAPTYHISISHAIDPVTFPLVNPSAINKVPNFTLLSNIHMLDALTAIETPNIGNADLPGFNFGAGHNGGLYWANVSQIMDDALIQHLSDQRVIVGNSNYSEIPDMSGEEFGVFTEYKDYSTKNDDDDQGSKFLFGDTRDEFILGLSGEDLIRGNDGADLLSGGHGNDSVYGGADDDHLSGGFGNDLLYGEDGNDVIIDGIGNNTVFAGNNSDKVIMHSGANTASGESGSDLVIGGIQADDLNGGAGNDVIIGDAGNGLMGGSDLISGGAGDDILMGGRGADVFVFKTNEGVDKIAGFSVNDVKHSTAKGYHVTKLGDDFQIGIDTVRLESFKTTDATNVMSKITDGTDGAVFDSEGTSITFIGIDADLLSSEDFMFA